VKFELRITSFGGIVPGATHYRGRVTGEHPRSCHGGTRFNAPATRGKTTCDQGHELPKQIYWDVEAPWEEDRYERLAAKHFEGDSPSQYTDESELVQDAIGRFLGLLPCRWWEEDVTPGQPGDELYLGYAPIGGDEGEPDGWGHRIAVVPS
jgi:hypothetical protein